MKNNINSLLKQEIGNVLSAVYLGLTDDEKHHIVALEDMGGNFNTLGYIKHNKNTICNLNLEEKLSVVVLPDEGKKYLRVGFVILK